MPALSNPTTSDTIYRSFGTLSALTGYQYRARNYSWPCEDEFSKNEPQPSRFSIDASLWKSAIQSQNETPKIISRKMLKGHNSKVDAWMVVRG
jgi:hypothetical protein